MLIIFTIVLLLAALFYAGLIAYFALGFQRVRRMAASRIDTGDESSSCATPFVTVLVAARDEETHIEACVRSIFDTSYPPDRFEVIVVDDFSTDGTTRVVHRLQHAYLRTPAGIDAARDTEAVPLRLLRMADHEHIASGQKHHALALGIEHAKGDLLLTTDADCTVGPGWIRAMVSCFNDTTAFVAGPVQYRPGFSLFGRFQALEFLALIATGAGGIGMGRPNMCNSANVAYRRDVYDQFGRLQSQSILLPGNDEILAQRLAAISPALVRFCARPEAVVETDPVLAARAFWAQRRRWAGTGPRYPQKGLVLTILGVYLFYLLLLTSLVFVWFWPALGWAVGTAMILKIASETTLLYPACMHFGQRQLFRYHLPAQPVQILYYVAIGMAAAFGNPSWKGRATF